MARVDVILFEDIFEVNAKDPDGKKFDKVSRFQCRSDLYEMDLLLDINIDVYPLEAHDKFSLALSRTLNMDGSASSVKYDAKFPGLSNNASLMDNYEYVMFGKVFKYKDSNQGGVMRVEVFVSFGGLLMQLSGDPKKLEALEVDDNIYLLMRKV
ncbi:MAG: hypothetical protein WDW38_009366 [Sanguina aurantia]